MTSEHGRRGPDPSPPRPNRPRALAVITFFPWPLNHGDALRRMMLLEGLWSVTDLTVVCLERADTTAQDIAAFEEQLPGARIIVLPLWHKGMSRTRSRVARVLRGLATARPPLLYQQWHPDLVHRVAELSREGEFELAVLIGGASAVCAGHVNAPHTILDTSNVMTASEIDALRTLSSISSRLRALVNIPLNYAYERRVLSRVDRIVVTSDEEGDRLRRFFGAKPSFTLRSTTYPHEAAEGVDVSSRSLLWMSTFNYPPNWDGLLRFLREAGAALQSAGFTLRVVGAGATDRQVEALKAFPCVDYRGYADKLTDACDGVAAAVVPVWGGAGVKLKTLTFFSLGVPVLATPVALEGIPQEAAAWVATTPDEFVEGLRVLTPDDLLRAAARGHALLEAQFSREAFMEGVARLVRESVT